MIVKDTWCCDTYIYRLYASLRRAVQSIARVNREDEFCCSSRRPAGLVGWFACVEIAVVQAGSGLFLSHHRLAEPHTLITNEHMALRGDIGVIELTVTSALVRLTRSHEQIIRVLTSAFQSAEGRDRSKHRNFVACTNWLCLSDV